MTLTLNGRPREFSRNSLTIDELLAELGLENQPVVVELDNEAVLPAEYPSRPVRDGSRLEIVTIAAGG